GGVRAAALAEGGVELVPAGAAPAASGAMLVMMEAGERTFVADPGANLHLAEADVPPPLAGADAVFVSGSPLLRPATRPAAMAAATVGGPAAGPAGGGAAPRRLPAAPAG